MSIPNLSDKLNFFWSHSSVLALEKWPKYLNFQSFLTLKDILVATFNETRAPTSIKYVAEQGIIMPNLSDTPIFLVALLRFFFGKIALKILNFQLFFSKRTFGGYFQ